MKNQKVMDSEQKDNKDDAASKPAQKDSNTPKSETKDKPKTAENIWQQFT